MSEYRIAIAMGDFRIWLTQFVKQCGITLLWLALGLGAAYVSFTLQKDMVKRWAVEAIQEQAALEAKGAK